MPIANDRADMRVSKLFNTHSTNIFDYTQVESVVLVNPVNCVGIMGAGLALHFKERYPNNFANYVSHCKKPGMRPGDILFFEEDEEEITIANLATKDHWRHKSHIEYIHTGLLNLHAYCEERANANVIMPNLGS